MAALSRTGRFGQSTLDQARQRPRTIYVDASGHRFVNESNSYMEVGKAMYARDKTSKAVPCWLIFDDRYRKRYAHQRSSPGRFPRKLLESGMLKQAWTLERSRPHVRDRFHRSVRNGRTVQPARR